MARMPGSARNAQTLSLNLQPFSKYMYFQNFKNTVKMQKHAQISYFSLLMPNILECHLESK